MPRRLRRLAATATLLVAITCGSLDTVEIEESGQAVVPGKTIVEEFISGALPFGSSFAAIKISDSEELANQGVEESDIDSVYLRSLQLRVLSPAGQDLSFMQALSFYAEAPDLPRVRIASGGPFEAGLIEVGLDLDDVDLKPYAIAESMSIATEATGSRPDEETTIEATLVLGVNADVSGLVCGE